MLKNLCQLENTINDKVCRFICENDTDINIIKEALFQFQKFIGSVEDMAKANKEKAESVADKPLETADQTKSVSEPIQENEKHVDQ